MELTGGQAQQRTAARGPPLGANLRSTRVAVSSRPPFVRDSPTNTHTPSVGVDQKGPSTCRTPSPTCAVASSDSHVQLVESAHALEYDGETGKPPLSPSRHFSLGRPIAPQHEGTSSEPLGLQRHHAAREATDVLRPAVHSFRTQRCAARVVASQVGESGAKPESAESACGSDARWRRFADRRDARVRHLRTEEQVRQRQLRAIRMADGGEESAGLVIDLRDNGADAAASQAARRRNSVRPASAPVTRRPAASPRERTAASRGKVSHGIVCEGEQGVPRPPSAHRRRSIGASSPRTAGTAPPSMRSHAAGRDRAAISAAVQASRFDSRSSVPVYYSGSVQCRVRDEAADDSGLPPAVSDTKSDSKQPQRTDSRDPLRVARHTTEKGTGVITSQRGGAVPPSGVPGAQAQPLWVAERMADVADGATLPRAIADIVNAAAPEVHSLRSWAIAMQDRLQILSGMREDVEIAAELDSNRSWVAGRRRVEPVADECISPRDSHDLQHVEPSVAVELLENAEALLAELCSSESDASANLRAADIATAATELSSCELRALRVLSRSAPNLTPLFTLLWNNYSLLLEYALRSRIRADEEASPRAAAASGASRAHFGDVTPAAVRKSVRPRRTLRRPAYQQRNRLVRPAHRAATDLDGDSEVHTLTREMEECHAHVRRLKSQAQDLHIEMGVQRRLHEAQVKQLNARIASSSGGLRSFGSDQTSGMFQAVQGVEDALEEMTREMQVQKSALNGVALLLERFDEATSRLRADQFSSVAVQTDPVTFDSDSDQPESEADAATRRAETRLHATSSVRRVKKCFGFSHPRFFVSLLPTIRRSLRKERVLPLHRLLDLILTIMKEKSGSDDAHGSNSDGRPLPEYIYEYYLERYGLRTLADSNVYLLLSSLKHYHRRCKHPRFTVFARLLGMVLPCVCDRATNGVCACHAPPPLDESTLNMYVTALPMLLNQLVERFAPDTMTQAPDSSGSQSAARKVHRAKVRAPVSRAPSFRRAHIQLLSLSTLSSTRYMSTGAKPTYRQKGGVRSGSGDKPKLRINEEDTETLSGHTSADESTLAAWSASSKATDGGPVASSVVEDPATQRASDDSLITEITAPLLFTRMATAVEVFEALLHDTPARHQLPWITEQLLDAALFNNSMKRPEDQEKEDHMIRTRFRAEVRRYTQKGLRAFFQRVDTDGDGQIAGQELRDALVRMGLQISVSDQARIVDIIDKDRSGSISYKEFLNAVSTQRELVVDLDVALEILVDGMQRYQREVEHDLIEQFKAADADGNGVVTLNEFRDLVVAVCPQLNGRQVITMFQTALRQGEVSDPHAHPDSLTPRAFIAAARIYGLGGSVVPGKLSIAARPATSKSPRRTRRRSRRGHAHAI